MLVMFNKDKAGNITLDEVKAVPYEKAAGKRNLFNTPIPLEVAEHIVHNMKKKDAAVSRADLSANKKALRDRILKEQKSVLKYQIEKMQNEIMASKMLQREKTDKMMMDIRRSMHTRL